MGRAVSFFKVHLFFHFPSITGADGEQQPELRQACVDLRNQRTTEDAALSAVHGRPLNRFISRPRRRRGSHRNSFSFLLIQFTFITAINQL